MICVHRSISRFAAFLLLAAAVGLPVSAVLSSRVSNVVPSSGTAVLTADGVVPAPPPQPIKQT
jgi:hypothetical protein